MDDTGIVIDLGLNHRGEIVGVGQIVGFLGVTQQRFQIVGFRCWCARGSGRFHHVFNDGGTALRSRGFGLRDVLRLRNRALLALFRQGRHGQKSAEQTQAKNQRQKLGDSFPQSVPIKAAVMVYPKSSFHRKSLQRNAAVNCIRVYCYFSAANCGKRTISCCGARSVPPDPGAASPSHLYTNILSCTGADFKNFFPSFN